MKTQAVEAQTIAKKTINLKRGICSVFFSSLFLISVALSFCTSAKADIEALPATGFELKFNDLNIQTIQGEFNSPGDIKELLKSVHAEIAKDRIKFPSKKIKITVHWMKVTPNDRTPSQVNGELGPEENAIELKRGLSDIDQEIKGGEVQFPAPLKKQWSMANVPKWVYSQRFTIIRVAGNTGGFVWTLFAHNVPHMMITEAALAIASMCTLTAHFNREVGNFIGFGKFGAVTESEMVAYEAAIDALPKLGQGLETVKKLARFALVETVFSLPMNLFFKFVLHLDAYTANEITALTVSAGIFSSTLTQGYYDAATFSKYQPKAIADETKKFLGMGYDAEESALRAHDVVGTNLKKLGTVASLMSVVGMLNISSGNHIVGIALQVSLGVLGFGMMRGIDYVELMGSVCDKIMNPFKEINLFKSSKSKNLPSSQSMNASPTPQWLISPEYAPLLSPA